MGGPCGGDDKQGEVRPPQQLSAAAPLALEPPWAGRVELPGAAQMCNLGADGQRRERGSRAGGSARRSPRDQETEAEGGGSEWGGGG